MVKNFRQARATKIRLREKLTDEIFTGENFPNYGKMMTLCYQKF